MPESFEKGLCKEILLQFSPLLGHWDMDWGQSGQEPATSQDFSSPPFPNPELPLSQTPFAWAHSGNLCQTTEPSTRAKLAENLWAVTSHRDEWCLLAVSKALGPVCSGGPGELS